MASLRSPPSLDLAPSESAPLLVNEDASSPAAPTRKSFLKTLTDPQRELSVVEKFLVCVAFIVRSLPLLRSVRSGRPRASHLALCPCCPRPYLTLISELILRSFISPVPDSRRDVHRLVRRRTVQEQPSAASRPRAPNLDALERRLDHDNRAKPCSYPHACSSRSSAFCA